MKNLGKNKLLTILAGITILIIVIIIILLIYHTIFGKTSYRDIENELVNAAKKYYSDNNSLLPKNEMEEVTITDVSLTEAGKLKDMRELTKKMKGVTCTAKVIVSYAGGNYKYTPLLDCGKSYSTKTLTSYIAANVEKVSIGSGLYDLNNELVYRGEQPNNYIKFSDKMWRIVKIVNNKAMIILDEKSERTVWDDRFNANSGRNDGINDYTVSRVYESITSIYEKNDIFSKNAKKLLSMHSLYIGKRDELNQDNYGPMERSTVMENQYVGLLPLYDYINASVDTNCNSAITASCTNYNYLNHFDYNWWTITADASNTYKVFRIASDGVIELIKASSNGYIRPVVYLASDTLYVGGTGTESDPYTVK